MDRKQHWEKVYSNKSPLEVSWYQTEPRLSLELIQATGLDKGAPVIDVGGGASVLVDRLLAAGYRDLSVLDISGQALAHARRRLGEQAARVGWKPTSPPSSRLTPISSGTTVRCFISSRRPTTADGMSIVCDVLWYRVAT